MIKFFTKQMNNRKGFTLIELIVVVAILGILIAIAVPRFIGIQQKARINADKATHESITRSIAVAVANETVSGDVTISTAETTGVITASVGGTGGTDPEILQPGAAVKVDANKDETFTWNVTDGEVIAPVINPETGEWTPDTP